MLVSAVHLGGRPLCSVTLAPWTESLHPPIPMLKLLSQGDGIGGREHLAADEVLRAEPS